ncbi:MAG: hypothetical protein Q4D80_02550 [Pseudomonadota bacterium]|nr:hypothetical protein [Pseudomonadota bacterium]
MADEEYISKEEALKKGYKHRVDGGYYKQSVLDKYYEKGYLELKNSKFSAADRKRAGERLCKDYYLGDYGNLQSVPLLRICGGSSDREEALIYKERYLSAMKSIPSEFWPMVRIVCIEDKEIELDKNIIRQSLLGKQMIYCFKVFLTLGLERLVKYYLQNK